MRRRGSASNQPNDQTIHDQSGTYTKLMKDSNTQLTQFETFVKGKLERKHIRAASQVETHQEGLKRVYAFKMPFLTKDLHLSGRKDKKIQNANSNVSLFEEEMQGINSKEKLNLLVSKEIFKRNSCLPEEFQGKVLSSRRTSMGNNQGYAGDSLSELEPKYQEMEHDHNSSTYKMKHNASRTTNFTVFTRNQLNDSCKNSKVFTKVGSYNMSLVGSANDLFSSKMSPKEEQQATIDYAGTIILPQESACPSLVLPEAASQPAFKFHEEIDLPKCLSELEIQQKLDKIVQRDTSSRASSRFKGTHSELTSAQEASIDQAAVQAQQEAEMNKIHKDLVLRLQAQISSQKPKKAGNGEVRTRRSERTSHNSVSVVVGRHSRASSIEDSRLDKSMARQSVLDRSFKQKTEKPKLPKLEVVPEWLKKREDFKDAFNARQDELSRMIITTCEKLPYSRTEEEIKAVTSWLLKVKLFRHLPEFMIYNIASKIRYQLYQKDQTICKQGDPEDYLFIIYDGIVRSYISGWECETYGAYDTIGQSPIDSGMERPMTLVAETDTSILKLGRHDYRNILEQHITQEKTAYFFLLNEVEVLKNLDEKKRKTICARLKSKHFTKGEVIYEEGEDPDYLYIVRSGKVHLESKVTIEKENIWPTGKHAWERTKHIRDMKFQHDIGAKCYFGEVEMINGYNRLNRVVCAEDAELLMLKSDDIFIMFDRDELDCLKRSLQASILEELVGLKERVVEEENAKKKITETTVKTLLGLKGNLKDKSIFRPKAHSLQPLAKKIQNNFKNHVQKNTIKTLKARQVFHDNPYCS